MLFSVNVNVQIDCNFFKKKKSRSSRTTKLNWNWASPADIRWSLILCESFTESKRRAEMGFPLFLDRCARLPQLRKSLTKATDLNRYHRFERICLEFATNEKQTEKYLTTDPVLPDPNPILGSGTDSQHLGRLSDVNDLSNYNFDNFHSSLINNSLRMNSL